MKLNVVAVAFIVIMIAVAHFFVPAQYDWTRNTVSELAAQGYRWKWIMQLGFIGFGVLLGLCTVLNMSVEKSPWYREVPLLGYAACILLSGVFCTKPFIEEIPFSTMASRLHSMFALLAGIAFSVALVAFAVSDPAPWRKSIHFLTLAFVVAASILFGMVPSYAGLIQRVMYTGSFAWLVIIYGSEFAGP